MALETLPIIQKAEIVPKFSTIFESNSVWNLIVSKLENASKIKCNMLKIAIDPISLKE